MRTFSSASRFAAISSFRVALLTFKLVVDIYEVTVELRRMGNRLFTEKKHPILRESFKNTTDKSTPG